MSTHLLPTFLGIGAQRAGTTWLYNQLRQHHEVWMPPVKELHFFDRDSRYPTPDFLATRTLSARLLHKQQKQHMRSGLIKIGRLLRQGRIKNAQWWWRWTFGTYDARWYRTLFRQGQSHRAVGEMTPSYSILDREDVAEIRSVNPDLKLIFMIRNPIERAWSAIRFFKKTNPDFNIDSENEIISVLQSRGNILRGDYLRTIETYLHYFPPGQLLVCFYDAIQADPEGLMNDIAHFLAISPFQKGSIDNANPVNSAPPRPMPVRVKEFLSKRFTPETENMARQFGGYATCWGADYRSPGLQPHHQATFFPG